ncbi:helix-turn-helix domain-containing protein [Amycolatopsis magusensis]|uniref:AraC-like DNA-binding protein n=1 Tax=Amycolatopsis magusensis TaxID=882444 RepID=A0ABS4PTN6_9PSEU|nr:helix-turn-helix domain-containing protein [Amycolatopsis magusensis]MBP2182683.1 AraC-like DNA-binding protein [Amycolatopsis magusensis]
MIETPPHVVPFGPIRFSVLTFPSMRWVRTPRLSHRSDPESYALAFAQHNGTMALSRLGTDVVLGSRDLVLYDSSHAYDVRLAVPECAQASVTIAQFPQALLPLPRGHIDNLLGRRIAGNTGVGTLLTQSITSVLTGTTPFRAADAVRLGTILLDLLTAVLAHESDAHHTPPPQHEALLLRIQEFVCRHLGEPSLSPIAVANAHHISLRQLHRLFRTQDTTVAAWIRRQRLDRCRRDLADPRHGGSPVHAIATRWGFTDPAYFSRAFRAAYGISPSEHRNLTGCVVTTAAGSPVA